MQKCVQNKFITVMLSQGRIAFLEPNNLLIEINKINMTKSVGDIRAGRPTNHEKEELLKL